ncbi:Nucleosomal histone H3-Lys79 methylase [Balamuthia mandrillaris]
MDQDFLMWDAEWERAFPGLYGSVTLSDAHDIPWKEIYSIEAVSGEDADTYGEISVESVETLIEKTGMNEQDVFYDLGCGLGRVVIHVALSTDVKAAKGLELSKRRITFAKEAKKKLMKRVDKDPEYIERCREMLRGGYIGQSVFVKSNSDKKEEKEPQEKEESANAFFGKSSSSSSSSSSSGKLSSSSKKITTKKQKKKMANAGKKAAKSVVEKISFERKDVTKGSWKKDATIIYMCSTCFSASAVQTLCVSLLEAKNLRWVAALDSQDDTPLLAPFNKWFELVDTFPIRTSWSPEEIMYLYRPRRQETYIDNIMTGSGYNNHCFSQESFFGVSDNSPRKDKMIKHHMNASCPLLLQERPQPHQPYDPSDELPK